MSRHRFWLRPARVAAVVASALLAAVPANPVAATPAPSAPAGPVAVPGFGSNPGNLLMYAYRPAGLPTGRPLVVALHGCTQSAADYHANAGWPKYADAWRFTVVLPEQRRANNFNGCFNWFQTADTGRDQGEALSVRQMVDHAVARYGADPGRVYVTGLSAGGAMTAAMLAAYPETFAGGAVIAGLAYRCAVDLISALSCMSAPPVRTPREWGALVRGARPGYSGPYPRVSVWSGTADTTVVPANADRLRDQWTDVWGTGQRPTSSRTLPGGTRVEEYADRTGVTAVTTYRVPGIRHGTPVDPGPGPDQCGTAATYYLDSVCSTYHVAVGWGLEK